MKNDYLILLAVAAGGIAFGMIVLLQAQKYRVRRNIHSRKNVKPDLRGSVIGEYDIVSPVTDLKGLVNKPDKPVLIEDMKIQSMQSLKNEMLAVARGEHKSPADAGNTSFESIEAVRAWAERNADDLLLMEEISLKPELLVLSLTL